MKNQLLLLLTIISSSCLFAQNTVTVSNQGMSSEEMIETIFDGEDLNISNVSYQGGENQIRFFSNNDSNLPLDSGLIMTTGGASIVSGPNNSSGATIPANDSTMGSSDPDLAQLQSDPVEHYDIAIIEFDFTTDNDTVVLRYSFASEEYNEFVCSAFNDAAAILLSGPGISGDFSNDAINISTIPNSNDPVGINSINNGTSTDPGGFCEQASPNWQDNSIYFFDNMVNYTTNIDADTNATQFDGFTVVLEAKSVVIPGETYHVKFVIGDGSDSSYDSGFMIEATAPVEYDCSQIQANVGDSCDDGNSDTMNDQVNSYCECEGTLMGEVGFFDGAEPYIVTPYDEILTNGGIVALNEETESVGVNVYWSENDLLDGSDELLYTFGGSFNSDTISFPAVEYPLPITQSDYYLIYEVASINDLEPINNQTLSLEINFTDNELVGVSTDIDSVFVQPDDTTITIDFNVFNNGPAYLSASEVEFYWSEIYNEEEIAGELVGTWTGPSVMAGDTLNAQFTFEIPLPINQYEYFLTLVPVDATKSNDNEVGGPIIPVFFSSLSGMYSPNTMDWHIFSNTQGELIITAGKVESQAQIIRIHDLMGRTVFATTISLVQKQTMKLDLPGVSHGIFLVELVDGNTRFIQRVPFF